jgi:hypothetical protein
MINRYPGLGEFVPFVDNENPRLSYIVFNSCPVDVEIHTGDPFGRFRFVRLGFGNLKQVRQFALSDKPVQIVEIPKTAAGYFKRMYRTDREQCIELFLDSPDGTELMTRLKEYRKTNAYRNASDANLAEAYWMWDNITPEIRTLVKTTFQKHRDEMIKQSRA